MIHQLDDRTLVSGQIAPHEVAGLADQRSDDAGQQPARRRGARPAAGFRNRSGGGSRPESPIGSSRSSAASARPTSRRCRRPCARPARASCSHSAVRARARRSRCRWPTAKKARRPRRSSSDSLRPVSIPGRSPTCSRSFRFSSMPDCCISSSSTISRTAPASPRSICYRSGSNRNASMPWLSRNDARALLRSGLRWHRLSCDKRHYQGTTPPAANSSARGGRPSTALRCGKRPKRSMMSRCLLA